MEKFELINNTEDKEKFGFKVEIPGQEIKVLHDIYSFDEKLFSKERADFGGPCVFSAKMLPFVNERFSRKIITQHEDLKSLKAEQRINRKMKLRREAEYETFKDEIEYKEKQFEDLMLFIESQNIFRYKFITTDLRFDKHNKRFLGLSDNRLGKFAGLNTDSVYYLTHSGASLRLKKNNLYFGNNGFSDVLQNPSELFTCRSYDAGTNDARSEKDYYLIPKKYLSLKPVFGYYVEEYSTDDFGKHRMGDFHSKIRVQEKNGKVAIKNFDSWHDGHQINEVVELNR